MANKEMVRLRELIKDELNTEMQDAKQELFNLKFQWKTTKQLANPARLGALRRKIAQINTIFTERELSQEKDGADA